MRHVLCMLLILSGVSCTTTGPEPQEDPRTLILRARAVAADQGEDVWPGFRDAPFGLILVERETDFLFCHTGEAQGFEATGMDPVLSCPSHSRPSTYAPDMLASFPAVDGVPTVVVGTPRATDKSPEAWILTVLHEHFHQMQYVQPTYYEGIAGLDLSGNDTSGMWMLNYPFPYDDPETAAAFQVLARTLLEALEARNTERFPATLTRYWHAREDARMTVTDADWRYFELQLWQEGVARWTEVGIGQRTGSLAEAATQIHENVLSGLENLDLPAGQRTVVYPIGAAEAMLLEANNPGWREHYWSEPFALGPLLGRMVEAAAADGTSGTTID